MSQVKRCFNIHRAREKLQTYPDPEYEKAKEALQHLINYIEKQKQSYKHDPYVHKCACAEKKRIMNDMFNQRNNFF